MSSKFSKLFYGTVVTSVLGDSIGKVSISKLLCIMSSSNEIHSEQKSAHEILL